MTTSRPASRVASPILDATVENQVRDDPLGKMLLGIVDKLNHLIEVNPKGGLPFSYNSLMRDFDQFSNQQTQKISEETPKLESLVSNVQEKLLEKELNFAYTDIVVDPPKYFSESPTLQDPKRMSDVLKIFPTRAKFTNPSNNIIEHLNAINYSQEIARLSETEFRSILPKCFGSGPYSHLIEWLGHGMDLHDIWFNLLNLYDIRDSPEIARSKLNNFKLYKDTKLTKLLANITILASRVSSILPPGSARKDLFNVESVSNLIRILPTNSSSTITNHINHLQSKLGRHPTFVEVTKALTPFTQSIERDIAANGYSNNAKNVKSTFQLARVEKTAKAERFSTGRKTSSKREKVPHEREGSVSNIFFNKEQENVNYQPRKFSPQNRPNNFYNNKPKKYCSLCGQSNHEASDKCFKMRNSAGKQLVVIPTSRPCPNCIKIDGSKLFHPEKLCFKKKGA